MIPQYFHKETQEKHYKNLQQLFDLNFGKDWRLFVSLYFSKEYGRHALHYNNPTEVEQIRFKNRNLAGNVRDAYFGLCTEIIKIYLRHGKVEARKIIESNKLRFAWYFKKGGEKQVIISNELYNALHKLNPEKTESIDDLMEPNTVEELHALVDKLNEVEAEMHPLLNKQIAEGLDEEERTKFRELKQKKYKLQHLIKAWNEEVNS